MKISGFKETIEWYDHNAQQYAEASKDLVSHDQLAAFVELLAEDSRILDAGCGSGRDTALLSSKGLNTIGLDLSSGLIAEARKRFPDQEFIAGSFLALPFNDESFDGVWAHASLVHLETETDVKQALTEFKRVLKTGGILHVLVKAQTAADKTAVVSDKLSGHDRFFQYFTLDEVSSLLQEHNFEVIQSEQYNEAERDPNGRPEVEWIAVLSKKTLVAAR
ncbi:MAG: class I SAM-dependent methyltransferase [Patescibacteria group bacterium]